MKHYAKEKLEVLASILEEVGKDEAAAGPGQDVCRMFLAYVTETRRGVPLSKMSHRARWRAVLTGILAMRWAACNFWTRQRLRDVERPLCAVAAIVDAVDRWFPVKGCTEDLRAVTRPFVRELRGEAR